MLVSGAFGEKIAWLFDLRNELVHGGSRYVKEWPKYQRYYRHFDTTPSRDIEKLAFAALLRAPAGLAKSGSDAGHGRHDPQTDLGGPP